MIELINHSVELIPELSMLQAIEAAGRTCYKSEAKCDGTEEGASKFVKMLCDRGHTAMCEHGTVYCILSTVGSEIEQCILHSKYSHCRYTDGWDVFVTTNFRVILEAFSNDYSKALEFVEKRGMPYDNRFEKRVSFRIICDRGVTHELVRHRVFSFAQESTRYVTYGVKQPTRFIAPAWWTHGAGFFEAKLNLDKAKSRVHKVSDIEATPEYAELDDSNYRDACFVESLDSSATIYGELLREGQVAQQARAVLPNALKTEIVMTGTMTQWDAFLVLRDNPKAHPDMQPIARAIACLIPTSSFAN